MTRWQAETKRKVASRRGHKREPLEVLLKRPCKRGHDRSDGWVVINPFNGNITINCKQCRKERLEAKLHNGTT